MTTALRSVRLGFAVPSGEPVDVPLKHLAICGQTQEAGKTTALEALITRAGVRALTFVTKRGESAFQHAHRVPPYFREQADWQFVSSILEASRGEKLKFERAWIIRASRGAQTLADVQRNVRKAMETAKGLAGDVYLTLDAYLEAVVPAIGRVQWAPAVTLAAGVNAMDLADLPTELQHLVIKSAIDWILEREQDTVVVIPEAWKFIPQGRGTPVKHAAAAFIRQGAALRNYLWLDSQDLGGIEKEILRSVAVWILGVQREANEIKRTLSNIPASVSKPNPASIATLELGQFFACWKAHAIKTYAQPAWVPEHLARLIARGELDAREVAPAFKEIAIASQVTRSLKELVTAPASAEEEGVTKDQAEQLTRDIGDVRDENRRWRETHAAIVRENDELRRRVAALEKGSHASHAQSAAATGGRISSTTRQRGTPEHDHAPAAREPRAADRRDAPAADAGDGAISAGLYEAIKARLISEAPEVLLKVVASRPELDVTVQRHVVEADGNSLRGRIAQLLAGGWFQDVKTGHGTFLELKRLGFSTSKPNVYKECDKLAALGFLTKESGGYRVVADALVRVREVA
jgi:hypothetical protein